jgi:DNA repair exonuclease SbcCD ATPase subunit
LQNHEIIARFSIQEAEQNAIKSKIKQLKVQLPKYQSLSEKLKAEINQLKEHKCYACGQDFHDERHNSVLLDKENLLAETLKDLASFEAELTMQQSLEKPLEAKPTTYYKTHTEAIKHQSEIDQIIKMIDDKSVEQDPYEEHLSEYPEVVLQKMPVTFYETESEAISHSSLIDTLETQIETKHNEVDPYSDQITDMETNGLSEISYDKLNELNKLFEHQKFLLDLLTNKDSFVRKKIIDQNLAYLNTRLTHYLEKTGLPHQVVFKNDLSIEISEHGRELDFGNLSRGETNRVIMSLSWAFRDVFENLYQPINVMFVDEILDAGLDSSGVENSISVLKDMARNRNKSIWLVSHKDELINRVNSILKVVKSNGFTEYLTDQVA